MSVLRDILVRFGIEVEGKEKLSAVDSQLKKTLQSAREFGAALKGFVAFQVIREVKNFIVGQIEMADQLQHNAERLGLTTDELQKYQYVAAVTQTTTEQAAVAFRYFNRTVGEAAIGTKSAVKTFALIGLNIKDAYGKIKPTDQLLLEFSDKLKDIPDQATRTAIAMRVLGRGGSSMLPALQMGSEELRRLFKDVDDLNGVMNKDSVASAHKADLAMKGEALAMRAVGATVVKELIPIIINGTHRTIEWAKKFIEFAEHTYGVKTALMTLAAAAGAMIAAFAGFKFLALMLTNPALAAGVAVISAIAIAFGVLYLAFDDLYTFLSDPKAQTVIGDWLNHNFGPGTADIIRGNIVDALKNLRDVLVTTSSAVSKIGPGLLDALVKSLPTIIEWGSKFTTSVLNLIVEAVHQAHLLAYAVSHLGQTFSLHPTTTAEQESELADYEAQKAAVQKLKDALNFTAASNRSPQGFADELGLLPAGAGGPTAATGKGTLTMAPITINVDTTIHGATDPKATGKAVKDGVKEGWKDVAALYRDTFSAVNAGLPLGSGF